MRRRLDRGAAPNLAFTSQALRSPLTLRLVLVAGLAELAAPLVLTGLGGFLGFSLLSST